MTEETRFCVDCKHCKKLCPLFYFGHTLECHHPSNQIHDKITGKLIQMRSIESSREYGCRGEWFERKGKK